MAINWIAKQNTSNNVAPKRGSVAYHGRFYKSGAGFMNRRRLCQLTAAILTNDLTTRRLCGFYEATQRLSCNCTSAELTQFDGCARGDDVMGNLTV